MLLASLALAGAAIAGPGPGFSPESLRVSGVQRTCLLRIPKLVTTGGGPVAGKAELRGTVLSAEESSEVWRRLAGISDPPIIIRMPDTDKSDDSQVELIRYRKDGLTMVSLYRVEGGGHTEPSLQERYGSLWRRILGRQNGDIEMAMEMWDFFSAR